MAVNKEDIRELTDDELIEKIKEEQLRWRRLKFNHTASQLDNPLLLRTLRRDIARLKTELRQRQLEAQATE